MVFTGKSGKKKSKVAVRGELPIAVELHDVWQIDGLENALIGTGARVSSLCVAEVKSSSLLKGQIFEVSQLKQLSISKIFDFFKAVFTQWGLPKTIQVDNGQPWSGANSEFPTLLAFWWIGLGIEVHKNRPHCPQENAFVENQNGLMNRWLDLPNATSVADMNAEMSWIETAQREQIKVRKCDKQTRIATFPELYTIKRNYAEQPFDFNKCEFFLQDKYIWQRSVGTKGQIEFNGNRISMGTKYAKMQISIQYNAQTHEFVASDDKKHLIKNFAIPNFTQKYFNDIILSHNLDIIKI